MNGRCAKCHLRDFVIREIDQLRADCSIIEISEFAVSHRRSDTHARGLAHRIKFFQSVFRKQLEYRQAALATERLALVRKTSFPDRLATMKTLLATGMLSSI